MVKLSKTGWNNVIIFSVLGFILLINATNKNVFSSDKAAATEASILPEHAVILTLSINNQITIERIGKTWRSTPSVIHGQALEQMMFSWQQSKGLPIAAPSEIDRQLALVVSLALAGQQEATVLSLHATDIELLIFNHQTEQWLSLPMQIYQQLLPSAIFSSE